MRDDLKGKVKDLMIETLMLPMKPAEIEDSQSLFGSDGLGLDSVDALQLVVALEKNFGLKIANQDAAKEVLASVETIVTAIEALEAANPKDPSQAG